MKEKSKKAILELFMPTVKCCICGEKTDLVYRGLCVYCLEELQAMRETYAMCDFCGNYYKTSMQSCPYCFRKKERRSYVKAASCFPYKDPAKSVVKSLKFGNGRYLAPTMAMVMHQCYDFSEKGSYDGIVAVPMTKKQQRKRGYNQSALLAKELSLLTGLPFLKGVLLKIKETPTQVSLSGRERQENLVGAYGVAPGAKIKGRSLLLVDDVMTTGATAHHCSLALKKQGAVKVKICTFCGAGVEESS